MTGQPTDQNRTKRRTFLKTTGSLAVLSSVAGCSGGGDGGGGDTTESSRNTFENEAGVEVGADWETVQDLAAEEDTMTAYAVIDRGPWSTWMEKFNEAYPDVGVEHVTGGNEKLGSRWFTEYETGNTQGSIYITSDGAARTWQEGTTMEMSGDFMPSFGTMADKFKDAENNNWIGIRIVMGSMHYNTDMISPDEIGDSWMDVVTNDSLAGGKFGHDPTPNMFLLNWLWNNVGEEYFTEMANLEPRWVDSHTDLARLTGAGEFPVSFTYTHKMGRFGNELPLDWLPVATPDGDVITPAQISPAMINNKAPQPNSAIVLVNWLTSVEGQNHIGTTQYIPLNPDAKYSGYEGVYPPKEGEVVPVRPDLDPSQMQERWKNKMGDQVTSSG